MAPFDQCSDDDLAGMVTTNLLVPMLLTRDALPLLRQAAEGRVVNIGSMFGDIAFPYFVGYCVSKFGMRGFSDGLRRELKPDGIGASYAVPRATKTPTQQSTAEMLAPLKMSLDEPSDVARHILDAVQRDKNRIYPKGMERIFIKVQALLPSLVDRAVTKQCQSLR